jgi:hypothetical protein
VIKKITSIVSARIIKKRVKRVAIAVPTSRKVITITMVVAGEMEKSVAERRIKFVMSIVLR